jgi:sulfatase maturation enzyme AslB (radical SAM superfamily)
MKKPPFPQKICLRPFQYLEIATPKEGRVDCYACCPTILPVIVGDLQRQTIEEVWNGEVFQEIRRSIIDGDYKHCKTDLCPEIQNDNLLDIGVVDNSEVIKAIYHGAATFKGPPRQINLSYDATCNLACPTCRTDFITKNTDVNDQKISDLTDQILERDLTDTTIIACSSGDPFVGKHFRRLLFTLDGKKHAGLKIQIMTNGLLFNRQAWESMSKIHDNIEMVCVSLDAASAETYKITRKGGSWDVLTKNLEFLSMLRQRQEISYLRLDFVVQDHNFLEMIEFVSLGEKFKVDQVYFQKVTNWGTFSQE